MNFIIRILVYIIPSCCIDIDAFGNYEIHSNDGLEEYLSVLFYVYC